MELDSPQVPAAPNYTTQIEDHNIRFHLLHKKCGSRVRNQLFCPVCKVVIERDETVRGYEVSKGQYVRVEDAELEALEAEANSSIDMREFIPIEKVDPIYFESTYYLAPDKGADKPYRLLADTMAKTGRVALAQTVFHNKESLVLIRSVKRGSILHFLFFKNEIRDFDAIAKGEDIKLPGEQLELGMNLIEKMSSADFEPERYADEYRERALAMIEKKSGRPGNQSRRVGATAHRPSRRYLRGIKEEFGNGRPAETHRRARQAQKEGVGTENQRPVGRHEFFQRQ